MNSVPFNSSSPRRPVMAHRTEPKLQRMQTRYRPMTGELVTLRQGAQNHGQTVGLPQMVGTPADVADQLEAYFDFVGGVASCSRRSIRRARPRSSSTWWCPNCSGAAFRRKYAGFTQRDHLGQDS